MSALYDEKAYPEQSEDRCALPALLPSDDYRKQMQQKIEAAIESSRETEMVSLLVSRQTYYDLLEAYRFLRQVNPWYKSVGVRLEQLSIQVRDALDKKIGFEHDTELKNHRS